MASYLVLQNKWRELAQRWNALAPSCKLSAFTATALDAPMIAATAITAMRLRGVSACQRWRTRCEVRPRIVLGRSMSPSVARAARDHQPPGAAFS